MFLKIFIILYIQFLPTQTERVITSLKYSKFRMKPTVVNGEPANNWQVPYLVSIKEPDTSEKEIRLWINLCGGSIIKPSVVLTAAHCFEGNRFHYAKRPYLLRAVAGNENTNLLHTGASGSSKAGSQWRQPRNIHIHKHFVFPNYDIALVMLNYPYKYEKSVGPVTLAGSNTDYLGACITAGYGRTGHDTKDPTSKILLLAPIDTMSRYQCSILWEMNMDEFICSTSVRSDVSEGDSGGPLACVHSMDPRGRDGRDLLMGLVSGKNFDKTTLFTRVPIYNNWINTVITTGSQGISNHACSTHTGDTISLVIILLAICFIR